MRLRALPGSSDDIKASSTDIDEYSYCACHVKMNLSPRHAMLGAFVEELQSRLED